jgi:hypothetical protein
LQPTWAFANIKGIARDPKDYEVYQPEVIIEEVPVEKVVEEIIKETPTHTNPLPSTSWGSPGTWQKLQDSRFF